MGFSIEGAYKAAEDYCRRYVGSGGAPKHEIDMPIAADSIDEYVKYIQSVIGFFACLDIHACRFYIDGAFCVDFFPTHQDGCECFRVLFPIVARGELGGKYGYGGKRFDDLYDLASHGIRRDYHDAFADGDFSSFRGVA